MTIVGNVWIIYDGRAESIDEDDCSILEMASTRRELKDMLYQNRDQDGVLFEYDTQGNAMLVNGRKVGHLREGKDALLARCSAPQHKPSQSDG